eukprot:SAG25_NODE_3111_length_1213_cov_1.637343_3_plen_36_part_01
MAGALGFEAYMYNNRSFWCLFTLFRVGGMVIFQALG